MKGSVNQDVLNNRRPGSPIAGADSHPGNSDRPPGRTLDRPGPRLTIDSPARMRTVRALETLIDIYLHGRFRIESGGLDNFSRSPSTLVVANHKRDADGPIICGVLLERRYLSLHGVVPGFVAREDLFRRGFLTQYLENWPRGVRRVLSRLDLSGFLWLMQAYPMRRIPERTLMEVLEAVLEHFGDLPLSEVLKPQWVEEFQRLALPGSDSLSVSRALKSASRPLLLTRYGLTKLTYERFRALKPFERATIKSQLDLFVELLERGGNVQLEPEGMVSPDGRFSRLRAGLHYLLNTPRVATRVLPVGITYDFMMTGRQRVFVNVGPEMTDLRGLSRRETDLRVGEAIRAELTVTASHLASQMLLAARARGGQVTAAEVLDHVAVEAERCALGGARVDPRLMDDRKRARRVYNYLEYCLKSGTLISSGPGRYRVRNGVERPRANWTNPEGVIDYVNNELSSFARRWTKVPESLNA